ncbi:crossover junction endodeoxyribonuclease RuvC [Salinibacterium sp. SYSU T00001]|uniref:crossover junction endodeoxyribonuclease RuvC n=1 Tax=Homoserinimonas sedimenticola TaxID=2986805 RepID=UPI0022360C38|nr:crossover junction endodeoxyribonuclease RuvC [Salinibacterium sedimenticola]MCW4384318.1 crossover junction endodeoxyribonuclease RuvC [Salinibacterium sedimenticola]
MSTRILGVDPGLTRCGIGVIDVLSGRRAALVDVGVVRTPPDMPLERRLRVIADALDGLMDAHAPSAVALERVFAQHNLKSVMGTAQVSGVVLLAAARRSLAVGLHTPSEVKAAVTGYGSADKKQVGHMVARILGLDAPPTPADASDALALALCHAWRGAGPETSRTDASTPAQRAWRAAERSAAVSQAPRRLES